MKYGRLLPILIIIFSPALPAFSENDQIRTGSNGSVQWPKYVFPSEEPFGGVKTIYETAYTISRDAGKNSRSFMYRLVLRYSTEGLLESEEYYDENGNEGNRIDYTYENGLLTQKTQSHPDVNNPDREYFRMLPGGRILENEKIFSSGNYGWKFKNSYDQDGRIVLTSKYDRYWNWMLVYSRMFEYDGAGRLSSTEGFGMKNELLWRDEYDYDSEGRVSESRKYNPQGELVVRIRNEYNSYGLFARREFSDMNDKSYAVYAYGWNTDERGNWTEKITGREVRGSGDSYIIPDSLVVRDIEYYE